MMTEGAVVLRQCGHLLTEYEQQEILPYTEIYFLGLESQKVQASSTPGNCNYGRLSTLLYEDCEDFFVCGFTYQMIIRVRPVIKHLITGSDLG